MICCSVIARPEEKNGDFRAPQNGRAGGREPKNKASLTRVTNALTTKSLKQNTYAYVFAPTARSFCGPEWMQTENKFLFQHFIHIPPHTHTLLRGGGGLGVFRAVITPGWIFIDNLREFPHNIAFFALGVQALAKPHYIITFKLYGSSFLSVILLFSVKCCY